MLHLGAKVRVIQRTRPEQRLAHCIEEFEFLSADLGVAEESRRALKGMEIVFNTTAQVGGIQYNMAHPGLLFQSNSILGLNLLEAARLEGAERFILASSTLRIRQGSAGADPEEYGFVGDPEPTNVGYAWAKRMGELQARFMPRNTA